MGYELVLLGLHNNIWLPVRLLSRKRRSLVTHDLVRQSRRAENWLGKKRQNQQRSNTAYGLAAYTTWSEPSLVEHA